MGSNFALLAESRHIAIASSSVNSLIFLSLLRFSGRSFLQIKSDGSFFFEVFTSSSDSSVLSSSFSLLSSWSELGFFVTAGFLLLLLVVVRLFCLLLLFVFPVCFSMSFLALFSIVKVSSSRLER